MSSGVPEFMAKKRSRGHPRCVIPMVFWPAWCNIASMTMLTYPSYFSITAPINYIMNFNYHEFQQNPFQRGDFHVTQYACEFNLRVNLIKRMHIKSRGSRPYRMDFVIYRSRNMGHTVKIGHFRRRFIPQRRDCMSQHLCDNAKLFHRRECNNCWEAQPNRPLLHSRR